MLSERTYEAATQSAAVFQVPDMGTIVVRGPDRVSWLNSLVTNDVQAVRPGTIGYGLALSKVGRILSDLWIVAADDRLLVGVPRDRVATLSEHLDRHLIMEDAALEDGSTGHEWLFAYGPLAVEFCDEEATRRAGFGGAVTVLPGKAGAIVLPTSRAAGLLEDLGRPVGPRLGSRDEWDSLRLRLLVPRFGIDFGDKNYPQEAWLEKTAVSFSKGCYLGQEVVCRLEMRGHVSKRLATIKLESGDLPGVGVAVRALTGDTVLATVSGAFISPRLGAPVAIAILPRGHMDPGAQVRVGDWPAVVVEPATARDLI